MDKKKGQPKAGPKSFLAKNSTITFDVIQQFSQALYRHLGLAITPIADGEVHRVDDPNGRPGNLACWYVCHLDGTPSCTFGNWRTGERYTHSGGRVGGGLSHRARLEARARSMHRKAARMDAQAQARRRAMALWEGGKSATVQHPYLARKRIPALNAREMAGWLLIPIWDVAGNLVNIQRIDGEGNKRFLKDGRIKGCFGLVGAPSLPSSGRVYLVEGWATAATVHAQTRLPVVAAMNATNLVPVALALREARPALELVVAADNDHHRPENPGITKGNEAAQAAGGGLVWPQPCSADCVCTDFNDVANCGRAKP